MIAFKTIGLAIAFSPTAPAMLAEARRLAIYFQSKLVLIHVGDHGAEEEAKMKTLIADSGLNQHEVIVLWKSGEPVKQILTACKSEKIDLLIAGALKKENLVNHYLGTIARKILHKADCSLLMITRPSLDETSVKNIVVNAEDSPYIDHAIWAACHWNSSESSWIHIVRELKLLGLALAANEQCNEQEYEHRKQQMLQQEIEVVEQKLKAIPNQQHKINIKIVSGKAGFELARFAERKEADLLVLGAPPRKFSFFTRVFPHDQEYIFNDLPCNVLMVQPRKTK
ncbi:MAG TPA: universal stress protein [Cytophagales bacterium]|nr:universal stress protein [Cytophagales bacterium]HRG07348.1 universal stress protein [Cyclobacteriaceae bacterium]